MDVYNYIDEYGIYSFKERKFNEVDAVIFSFLSYVDFSKILNPEKHTMQELGKIYLGINKKNIIAVNEATKLFNYLKDCKRYKDCLIYDYEYIGNKQVQFGAISIEYLPGKVYVSFEGTDALVSGWIEDIMLSYEFPTKSHKLAIKYLNKHFTFSLKELIIGGHSKGGNLALVSGMYANPLVKAKIKKIYNCDGPGLLNKEFKSQKYKKILKNYTHIIPDYSIVGILLNHSNDHIIKSKDKGILAHNIVNWTINKNKFEKSNLSAMSKEVDKDIQKWFKKYSKQNKKDFVENFNYIINKSTIESLLDLKNEKKKIITIIKESKEMDESTKKMLLDLFAIGIKSIKNTRQEELKELIVTNVNKVRERFKTN